VDSERRTPHAERQEYHGGNIYGYERPILDFSANINPLGAPDSFKQAIGEKLDAFTCYPEPTYGTLKRQVAAYLAVEPEWVVVGNGAVDLIYKAIQTAAHDRVYIPVPTFSEYRRAASLQGLNCCEMPVFTADYSGIDSGKMLKMIQPDSTVVLGNPNNPTGTLIPRDELERLAADLAVQNCSLIVDEAFMEFTDYGAAATMPDMMAQYPNLLIIRAATKFFGLPGIRLGYGVTANQDWRERILALEQPWSINTAAVIAAAVIFKDRKYIQRTRDWIGTEKGYFFERLTRFSELLVYPSQANFFLIKLLRRDFDAYQLQAKLLEHDIMIRTPQGFSGLTPEHFRVAIKERKSNDLLLRALGEVLGKY
jgi:threonine-phosphate decarboxylase